MGETRGRPDRSTSRGLRLATGSGNLIKDIRRERRRHVIKRVMQLVVVAVAVVAAGIGFKIYADRHAVRQALQSAREHAKVGAAPELRLGAELLDASLQREAGDRDSLAERAMLRAHLWVEFAEGEEAARAAVAAAGDDHPAARLAAAEIAFGDGDPAQAREQLDGSNAIASDDVSVRAEAAWLGGLVELALAPDDDERLRGALSNIDATLATLPANAPLRRVRARLLLQLRLPDEALAELARARELARSHLGLAADEALFNAVLGREPTGVASVADQLLEQPEALPARDRYNTLLARAVVHVHAGEFEQGVSRLQEAWDGLPKWDRMAVRLAIETALEAADADLATKWLADADLPEVEKSIGRAWATLTRGELVDSLTALAGLPQEHPRVGYLQALALVEQGRWREAEPWIRRTEELMPGRIEIEVARARAEIHLGDKATALRKLESISEEEPWAPRAWTGLGEAYLAQSEPDLRKAKVALQRAIDREPVPAEAMLLLADVWNRGRASEPEGVAKAQALLEQAAKTCPSSVRYREQLAYFLADASRTSRARKLLSELVEEKGIAAQTVVLYVRLGADAGDRRIDYEKLLAKAAQLGAEPTTIERERARVALATDDRAKAEEARAIAAGLVQRDPSDVESRLLLSEAYVRLFDRKEAELAARRGFSHVPESKHGRLYLAWAAAESRLGKPKLAAPRARSAWQRMLDEDRPAAELLPAADLATKLWIRAEQERIALSIAEQLTRRLPEHAEGWTIRARTELAAAETFAARASVDRAIALDPDSPRAHEIRGHCFLRFGQKDKARQAYERAVELADGTRMEKEYRENLHRL